MLDLAGYLTAYTEEMAFTDEDPGVIVDRYHTPDIEWFTDGLRLDREKLVAHARPVRRNAASVRIDVHDVLVTGTKVAARYTLSATMRKGGEVVTEIYMFAVLGPDGRIRRIDQITRTPIPS